MDERVLIELSAYADGELDSAARQALEHVLARQPELLASLRDFKRLDSAAATMEVPRLDAGAGVPWASTDAPVSAATAERLAQAADTLSGPQVSAEKYARLWTQIAARTVAPKKATTTPVVSDEQWGAVWRKVSERTWLSQAGGHVTRADFQAWRRRSRLRWILAAGMAAAVLLSLYVTRPAAEADNPFAMLVPEVLDDRYEVHVKYLEGHASPVVCFYLKNSDSGDPVVPGGRWLPD